MSPASDPSPAVTRVAVIGLGGFAQAHHRAVHAFETEGLCRLVATCDPAPDAFAEFRAQLDFDTRGVRIFDDYRALLDAHAAELDLVTIPTPIPLHAEMHRACVERRRIAYLEKPPTLDLDEFARMVEVERSAVRPTIVGFQMMSDPARRQLKRRLAAGEFGRVRRVSFLGLWPRSDGYYRRNNWAGRLMLDGRLVLDSCFGNAMAHYLNNCCHWAADGAADAWQPVESIEAELYRAHPIEGADTVFARGRFAGGAELRLAMSHACDGLPQQCERIECERATIEFVRPDLIRVLRPGAESQILADAAPELWKCAFRDALNYVAGRADRPGQLLAETAPFVHLNALIYVAAGGIRTVQPPYVVVSKGPKGDTRASLAGVQEAADTLLREGRLPSEQGLPWAARNGGQTERVARATDLARLRQAVEAMAAARAAETGAFKAY